VLFARAGMFFYSFLYNSPTDSGVRDLVLRWSAPQNVTNRRNKAYMVSVYEFETDLL